MKILRVGLSAEAKALMAPLVKAELFLDIATPGEFYKIYENLTDDQISLVICQAKFDTKFAMEVAQVMRTQCPTAPSFCICYERSIFEKKAIIKNGYTQAFLLPVDRRSLADAIAITLSPEALAKRSFKSVRIPDFQQGTKLSFPTFVYLPVNNKFVPFTGKNEEFSERKAEKLKKHQHQSLFIDQKDANTFYEYVAEKFKSFNNQMGETERKEKIEAAVRDIFHDIFNPEVDDFDSGRELMASCRKLVSTYITGNSKDDWYRRLMTALGGESADYSHSADVSTFAALIGLAVGSQKIEELAIAGFLHDISLSDFPFDFSFEPDPGWTDDVRASYVDHPFKSVNLLKTKKMIVSEDVEKIIMQHHEKFVGGGFPKGLSGDRLSLESQILSLADQLHTLTSVREGQPKLSPLGALEVIEHNKSIDPALLRRVRAIFPMPGSLAS